MAARKGQQKTPGSGRKKGSPNKATAALKDMILEALAEAGGVDYLKEQAQKSPAAFLTLVGKVLPLQLTGEGGGPMRITTPPESPLEVMAELRRRKQETA